MTKIGSVCSNCLVTFLLLLNQIESLVCCYLLFVFICCCLLSNWITFLLLLNQKEENGKGYISNGFAWCSRQSLLIDFWLWMVQVPEMTSAKCHDQYRTLTRAFLRHQLQAVSCERADHPFPCCTMTCCNTLHYRQPEQSIHCLPQACRSVQGNFQGA